MKISFVILVFSFFISTLSFSQTLINSYEDWVQRFLFSGEEKGFFNSIRSFSFNSGSKEDEAPLFRLLDISSLSSYNSHQPHGMNDESFWQGKGFNSYLTGGFKGQYKEFSLTIYPEFWYASNLDFEIVPPKVGKFGSFLTTGIDNPQRYGDEAVLFAGFGQSEIRYTGQNLTIGMGTQSLWLGPGIYNSLILSNNAGGFPKLDIGMRDINTPIGMFEFFVWWGILKESEFFDDDSSNDLNLHTGLRIDYRPPIFKGLSIGLSRTLIANLADVGPSSFGSLFIPFMTSMFGEDENDQRASITFDWLFPEIGFNIYLEWAKNDYSPSIMRVLEFPQRTQAYTLGFRQLVYSKNDLRWVVGMELSELVVSWDYTIAGSAGASFYYHHIVLQGYTNNGQILGAGIGTGSNSQTIDVRCYFKDGMARAFAQRVARTQDYLFTFPEGSPERSTLYGDIEIDLGLGGEVILFEHHRLLLGFEYSIMLNWNYERGNDVDNFYLKLGYSWKY